MHKYLKFSSDEAGPFNDNGSLITFKLDPSLGPIDPRRSYIQLNSRVDVSGTTHGRILNVHVKAGPDRKKVENVALINNFRWTSQNGGILAEDRDVGRLQQNVLQRTLTKSEKEDRTYFSLASQSKGHEDFLTSPFVELNRDGSDKSRYLDHPLKIPLSDIDGLGNVKMLPLDKLGQQQLTLEINNTFLRANNFEMSAPKELDDVAAGDPRNELYFPKGASLGRQANPFYVGQLLDVTNSGTNKTNTRITKLEKVVTGGNTKIKVTVNKDLDAGDIDAISVKESAFAGGSYAFNTFDAKIVVCQLVGQQSPKVNKLRYRTYKTDLLNTGSGLETHHQIALDPRCVNILGMNGTNANKYAEEGDIFDWRLAIDGIETTNRNIEVLTPLYLDRLSMTFKNMGKPLNDLNPKYTTVEDPYNGDETLLIAQPVPLESRMLELNVYGAGALPATLNVYQEIIREIDISNNNVSVK